MAGQRSDAVEIIQDKVILFYRKLSCFLQYTSWRNRFDQLPIIKLAFTGIKQAKALAAVLYWRIKMKAAVCSTKEYVYSPVKGEVRKQFHGTAYMAIARSLDGI